jgi:hypothetical protein
MASPPSPGDLDRRLFAVLARGMAYDPADRWPSVEALRGAIAHPPRARAPFVAAAVALVAIAIVVAILL